MSIYEKIYRQVECVPDGKVATYGQIARLVGGCAARQVGYAMAALSEGAGVPWHRIVNHKGEISLRGGSDGHRLQRVLLEAEGVVFSENGKINLETYLWRNK